MDGINVMGLFNGMNTGRQALENLGFKVDKYYSSELKSYAIELTNYHFSDTIELGDIRNWRNWNVDWKRIDLVLSGSPCKDLSGAGNRAGIYGENSGLFWIFIEILEHIKKVNPNVIFFQENVGSASKKDIGIMSRALGVYPCRINSSLVTAQLRDRYYWSNMRTKQSMFDTVTDIPQPEDKGIFLKDIIEHGYTDREKAQALLMSEAKTFGYTDREKFTAFIKKRLTENRQVCNYVYVANDKANAILESESRAEKGNSLHKRVEKSLRNAVYQINPSKEIGGNQPYQQNRVYDESGKHVALTESVGHRSKIAYLNDEAIIRPLTKTELCRLQGFPDDYCDILSRNKAASLLGDGWTLTIIEHCFQYLPFKRTKPCSTPSK